MFFFKQKTAFELHISDWSSDVCSSDRAGAFGIRIENLVVVTPQRIAGAEEDMLGFETITFAPIAQNLVEVALLSGAEADRSATRRVGIECVGTCRSQWQT